MSYDYNDDFADDQNQNGPKALRDQLDKLKAQLAEAQKENASLKETNTALETKVKSSTLRDAFADAGIDAKYARFAERDGVEPSKEAVEKWRDENREVYAFLATKPAEPAKGEGEQVQQEEHAVVADNVSPELLAALAQAQGLESAGHPTGSSDITTTLAGVDATKVSSQEDIVNLLGRLGAPLGD